MKADEIMVINGAIVSDLDMMFIESVLQEELTLCMMLRSSRTGNSFRFFFLKLYFKFIVQFEIVGVVIYPIMIFQLLNISIFQVFRKPVGNHRSFLKTQFIV